MRKVFVSIIMVAVAIAAYPQSAHANVAVSGDEQHLFNLVNDLRASKGLAGFSTNDRLFGSARPWTSRMADAGTISHNPNLRNEGPDGWRRLGENVAMGGSIEAIHNSLIASPAHYANLIEPSFSHIGLGVVRQGNQIFVTQTFAALPSQASAQPQGVAPAAQAQPSEQPRAAKATKAKKAGVKKAKKSRSVRKVRKARSSRVSAKRY